MSTARPQTTGKRPGLIVSLIAGAVRLPTVLILTLVASLLLNILIELVGITCDWWDEPGATHSVSMLATELGWLHRDFQHAIGDPAGLAKAIASALHRGLFYWNGVDHGAVSEVPTHGGSAYLVAAIVVVQIFAARLAVMVLSLPAFAVFALVAFVDGLVARQLRRWGGANEEAFVYHHVKRWVNPMLVLPIAIYLSLPVSVHPNFIVMPFVLMFALAVWGTTATFKQHL